MKLFFQEEEEHAPEQSLAFRGSAASSPRRRSSTGTTSSSREDGRRVATPLLLCLALIEVSDVIFALDSIPAIFGVTLDPFIVFTSNIFAILGLRSLYFASRPGRPVRLPQAPASPRCSSSSARR